MPGSAPVTQRFTAASGPRRAGLRPARPGPHGRLPWRAHWFLVAALSSLAGCRANHPSGDAPMPKPVRSAERPAVGRTIQIDLLAIDLTTCGRCTGTESNLDAAFKTVADRLRPEGVAIEVRKTVVRTADQAVRLRFVSSPTIRVDGRDIAMEFRESDCKDCGDLCGGASSVDCRVWVWKGREYTEAPKAMIVEAILRAYREGAAAAPPDTAPFRLPENLRRYFAAQSSARPGAAAPCCPPAPRGRGEGRGK